MTRVFAQRGREVSAPKRLGSNPFWPRSCGRHTLRFRLAQGPRPTAADCRQGARLHGNRRMMRIAMSAAASGLLRALIARTGVPADRILLTEARSIDWQSLTFVGERHELGLRIAGPEVRDAVARLTTGLSDAEFSIPGHLVADVAVRREPRFAADGSATLTIDALTIAD